MKLTKTTLQVNDILELEEMDENITKNLIFHQAQNKDFSYLVETDYEEKVLTIKTLYLDEQQN